MPSSWLLLNAPGVDAQLKGAHLTSQTPIKWLTGLFCLTGVISDKLDSLRKFECKIWIEFWFGEWHHPPTVGVLLEIC